MYLVYRVNKNAIPYILDFCRYDNIFEFKKELDGILLFRIFPFSILHRIKFISLFEGIRK